MLDFLPSLHFCHCTISFELHLPDFISFPTADFDEIDAFVNIRRSHGPMLYVEGRTRELPLPNLNLSADEENDPLGDIKEEQEEEIVFSLNADDRNEVNDLLEMAVADEIKNGDDINDGPIVTNVEDHIDNGRRQPNSTGANDNNDNRAANAGGAEINQNANENDGSMVTDGENRVNNGRHQPNPTGANNNNRMANAGGAAINQNANENDGSIVTDGENCVNIGHRQPNSTAVTASDHNENISSAENSVRTFNDESAAIPVELNDSDPDSWVGHVEFVGPVLPKERMPLPMGSLRHGMVKYENDSISGNLSYKTMVRIFFSLHQLFVFINSI